MFAEETEESSNRGLIDDVASSPSRYWPCVAAAMLSAPLAESDAAGGNASSCALPGLCFAGALLPLVKDCDKRLLSSG